MRSVQSRLTLTQPRRWGQQCCSADPSKPLCRDTRDQMSERRAPRYLISEIRRPSSVFEMPVPDPCEFLAARRWLGIEPAAHLFTRAAERLRNSVEAVAFAGHALRSHQVLERPW